MAQSPMSPEVRSLSLGASESAMAIGMSPFGDAGDLYRRKRDFLPNPTQTEAMARGNRQEDFVANEAAASLGEGVEIRNRQLRVHHPQEPWISATLDGIAYRGIECLGVTEFKTINQRLWLTPPDYYRCQLLHQMYVTGIPAGYLFGWSTKDTKLGVWEFHWEEQRSWWEPILAECRRFWFEHVVANVPPQARPKKDRLWSDLPNALLDRYVDLGDLIKLMEDERKGIKQQIFDALGNPEENLSLAGDSFKVDVKRIETSRVNTKKLPTEIAEAAREVSVSYRLDVDRVGLRTFGNEGLISSPITTATHK